MALFVALAAPPALADPAGDIAVRTAAIEAALADKTPQKAETLARSALEFAQSSLGKDSLEAANLDRLLGDSLFDQQRFADAEPYYRQALAVREARLGDSSPDTIVSTNDLAIVLKRLEQYAESENYYRKVVEMRTAVLGPDDVATARALFFLSDVIDRQGRYGEAAEVMAKAIASAGVAYGPRDPETVDWMGARAAMLHDAGDLATAEAAYREAIALGTEVFEPMDARLAYTRQGLANLYFSVNRFGEAAPLYRLALAGREASFGPDDPRTMSAVSGLAHTLWSIGETDGLQPLLQRLLAYREATDGAASTSVADVLRMIGWSADTLGHKADAEIAFKRVLEISEARLGPSDPYTALDLVALGTLYSGEQRFDEARPLLTRGVGILEATPETLLAAASARTALSLLEQASGNGAAAIALAQKSLNDIVSLGGARTREAADIAAILGDYQLEAHDLAAAETNTKAALALYEAIDPSGRSTLRAQSTLAAIQHEQGRLGEALALQRQVLDALVTRYGSDSSETWAAYSALGSTLLDLGEAGAAADAFGKSAAIVSRLASVDAQTAFSARTGEVEDQALAAAKVFDGILISAWDIAAANPSQAPADAEAAFLTAQRVIDSRAATALTQMSARQASGTGELAALVRERQDLVAAWQHEDSALTAALGAAASPADTAPLRASLAAADARIDAIDADLASDFPAFATLQHPAPLSMAEVQKRLGENDVLLLYADTGAVGATPAEAFVWVVPKGGAATWLRLAHGPADLRAAVRAFREAMGVGSTTRGPTAVAKASGPDRVERVLTAAHELYATLLGDVEPLIVGKSLVIVPSRSLSALPFHALVSTVPAAGSVDRFRDARWVATDHAITVLPSVTSLAVPAPLAEDGSRTAYVAFANPLLTGRSGSDRRAFARAGCDPATAVAADAEAVELPALPSLFRGAEADVAAVRALPPLPETADEVCAIAATLGAGADALHLGAGASEAEVKALSADGLLAQANTVHFATHGLVSGDLSGLAEPAIVLTPPDDASADDDGLLTASEVTTLKLDADWVILSACNTAAGDAGGEALSGLARAFFYAGARALLVSHWPVSSDAAVRLTTGAMAALEADPEVSKAEAMRRAMVTEISRGGIAADPVSWAPFIVVGQ